MAAKAGEEGEHGRGFAVVAAEVRSLAKRCADSAREIKGLVLGATQQVTDGAKLVDEVAEAYRRRALEQGWELEWWFMRDRDQVGDYFVMKLRRAARDDLAVPPLPEKSLSEGAPSSCEATPQ